MRPPPQPVATRSLEMLGYRVVQDDPHGLFIYPYWYARQSPRRHTRGLATAGQDRPRLDERVEGRPYFNSQKASNWPAATLVDDAYLLPLPPGLAAGTYELAVQVTEGDEATAWTPVGTVNAKPPPVQPQPAHALAARFGGQIDLVGVDLKQGGRAVEAWAPRPPVVRPGDSLEYTPLLAGAPAVAEGLSRPGAPGRSHGSADCQARSVGGFHASAADAVGHLQLAA